MLRKRDWLEWQERVVFPRRAYIDGEFIEPAHCRTFECVNPANGRRLTEVCYSQESEVDAAVMSGRDAFERGRWREQAPAMRKAVLLKLASLIMDHKEELALLESLDMGKPVRESLALDIPAASRTVAWYAEAIDKVYGEIATTADSTIGLISREPLGVVGAIVPWNFPLLMTCWKIAPALACGNSVILKPSEKSPLTALRIAELATEAGIPRGVLNVLPGFGDSTGRAIALHPDVDGITFTGSTAVGKRILEYAGQSNMKRTFLECGGKSANIVFGDCYAIDSVAKASARAIFYNQGEVCSAASRLIVEKRIAEQLVAAIIDYAKTMMPGDPLDENSYMGAIVDEKQFTRVMSCVDAGVREGATLRFGGRQVHAETGGYYIEPTIFDGVTRDMSIFREEIFGPVLAVTTFETEEDAIALANDTRYGLAGAVWSRDIGTCHRVARALRVGSVSVNSWLGGDLTVPFGGFKQSGNGRDKSLHAMQEYTELKSTWISL